MWADQNALRVKRAGDAQTILASTTTAAGAITNQTTTAVALARPQNGIIFTLDVTAAATDVGDTLDVSVQTTTDGTNWTDVVAFTQVVGNGGVKRHVAKILTATAQAMFEVGTALTAGSIRHLFGDTWRLKYTQVDANSNGTFTFAVYAMVV